MANLTGWQAVAREIGDCDLVYEDMEKCESEHTVGDWLPAEAAAKEILRLRENSDTVALNEDVHKLLRALGISDHARPVSCHRVVNDEILPAIILLRERVKVLEIRHHRKKPKAHASLIEAAAAAIPYMSRCPGCGGSDLGRARDRLVKALAAAEEQQETDR